MKHFLSLFLPLFLLFLNVYSFRYTIVVSTSNLYFQPRFGTFKLYFHGINFMDNVILRNDSIATFIKPFETYYLDIDYGRQIESIYAVSFYWTLKSPYDIQFLFNRPFIYINQVSIRPTYFIDYNLDNKVEQSTKVYCTSPLNAALRHKEIVQLVPCRYI